MLIPKILLPSVSGALVFSLLCAPTFAMRAPASSQSPTAAEIEQILQAGSEEQISIFIEPAMRDGALAGRPEPYQPPRKTNPSSPDIWNDTAIRQAEWVVLAGIPTEEGKAKDSRGKAVIRLKSLGDKPIVTAADYTKAYNREVLVKVRPDPAGALPQVLAVYNSAKEIISGIQVYVDTGDLKITGGGPKKDEKPSFLTDDIGPALWKNPLINNDTAQRVFLRGIPAYSYRGWSAFRIGDGNEVVTIGRYSTLHNRTVMAELGRNPEAPREWIVAKVFNGARENISPTFSKSDINVYLDTAPAGGLVPSGSRARMTTSLLGPTFWGNMEVSTAQSVLLEGVPVTDYNGVAGVKVGQRQIVLTDLPYDPDAGTRLLIYTHPSDRQGLPFAETAFEFGRKVYPARKILVSVEPVISGGRIESADQQFWLDADKVDAGQFWNLTEIRDARRVAWSGAAIEDANGYASVKVGDSYYRSDIPFPSLEGDQLLVIARPDSRELVSAFRLLNAERVSFRKAAGLEEQSPDIFAAMIADLQSELSQVDVGESSPEVTRPALIVPPDGLPKLSAAPAFLLSGRDQFRIEALATDEEHRKRVQGALKALGFTNYRVHNVREFGGVDQAVAAVWEMLSAEAFEPMLVTAAAGLEAVGRFLGRPPAESSTRALQGPVDRYRSLWA